MTPKSELDFKIGDSVVYPAHGVGAVVGVENQEVAGLSLEVYVITFDHEKMTLRVPTKKARTAGLGSHAARVAQHNQASGNSFTSKVAKRC